MIVGVVGGRARQCLPCMCMGTHVAIETIVTCLCSQRRRKPCGPHPHVHNPCDQSSMSAQVEQTSGFALYHPLFGCARAKLYYDALGSIGTSCYWEQTYFLAHFGITNQVMFRKDQKSRASLEKLAASWELAGASYHYGHHLLGNTCTLRTDLLVPWLLKFFLPKHHKPDLVRQGLAVGLLNGVLALCGDGWRSVPFSVPLAILNDDGHLIAEASFDERSRVDPSHSFLSLYPEARAPWMHAQNLLTFDGYHLGDIDNATPLDWCVFWDFASRQKSLYKVGLREATRRMATTANARLAEGVELWLLTEYAPSMRGDETPRSLSASSTRKRRMDDVTKLVALRRSRKAHGNSDTFLHGATGDKHVGYMFTLATCNLYLELLPRVYGSATRMSLVWDPGSYSGWSVSVGMVHSVDLNIAATLPIKVCDGR